MDDWKYYDESLEESIHTNIQIFGGDPGRLDLSCKIEGLMMVSQNYSR